MRNPFKPDEPTVVSGQSEPVNAILFYMAYLVAQAGGEIVLPAPEVMEAMVGKAGMVEVFRNTKTKETKLKLVGGHIAGTIQ